VKVDYSSPRAKGRKIMANCSFERCGGLARMNPPHSVTDANLTIGGKGRSGRKLHHVTVPAEDKWSLVISKKTGEWGTDYPEGQDLGRYDMSVSKTRRVEKLHDLIPRDGTGCMYMDWRIRRATIELTEKK